MTNASSKILKQRARILLMGKYLPSISMVLLTYAISFLLTWLLNISGFSPLGDTLQQICYVIMNIVILLLEAVFSIGLIRFFFQMTLRQPFSPKDLFYGFSHDPDRFILAAALRYGLLLIGWLPAVVWYFRIPAFSECTPGQLLTLAALALLGVLLNLPVLLLYGQSFYILLEHPDCSILGSMQESRLLMEGQKKRLFFLYLSFLGYGFLELGTMGLADLWIRPYLEMTQIQFYLDLTGRGNLNVSGEDPRQQAQPFDSFRESHME